MKPVVTLLLLFVAASATAQGTVSEELFNAQIAHENAITRQAEPLNERYEQDLQKLLRKAMSASDLEGAQKVKDQIAALPHNVGKEIVGTWELRSEIGYSTLVTFKNDGTGSRSDTGAKIYWFVRGGSLFIGLPQAVTDRFELPSNDGKFHGVNLHRHQITLTKK